DQSLSESPVARIWTAAASEARRRFGSNLSQAANPHAAQSQSGVALRLPPQSIGTTVTDSFKRTQYLNWNPKGHHKAKPSGISNFTGSSTIHCWLSRPCC